MALSNDLISQFVKVTAPVKQAKKEETVYGTIVVNGDSKYVKLDGSDLMTPISTTADTKDGERVTVMIKNHTATVTGNISSPAARVDDLGELPNVNNKIVELETLIAEKVSTKDFDAQTGRIEQLVAEDVLINNKLTANEAEISKLEAEDVQINKTLTAANAKIGTLETDKLDAEIAEITYASIVDLKATNANVHNLEGTYADFVVLSTERFTALNAAIEDLDVKSLTTDEADVRYANIDFSNIGKAALEEFFSKSGLIENVIIGDATISGKLVGVTVSGDLIEGNTVVAEKLVIKGSDGLYYKLNTDGMKVEAEQTDQNSLNGQIIKAKSITASKITVTDLVAFGATIGGYKITNRSLYSGVKESVDNATNGVYLGDDGQVSIGGVNSFIKFYKDQTGVFRLAISADSLTFGSKDVDFMDEMQNTQNTASEAQASADANESRIAISESMIKQLSDMISSLVVDENGGSLMTQTSEGWVFDMGSIEKNLGDAASKLNDLSGDVGDIDNCVRNLTSLVNDLSAKTAYIVMTTDDAGNPCIELGKYDNQFKLRITNTTVDFLDGSSKIAYVSNKALYIERAVIKDELQIGEDQGFVWKKRSNGNMSLRWIGG